MDWKRSIVGNGTAEYYGQIGLYAGTKATATVYRVKGRWTASANVEGKAYAVDTFGWFKTAKEAMRTVATLCEVQIAHNAKEEREAGYPKAKAHAAKAGAEFAKAVTGGGGNAYASLSLDARNGTAARRSFRSHAPFGSGDMWTAYLAEWELHYRAARGFPSATAELAKRADDLLRAEHAEDMAPRDERDAAVAASYESPDAQRWMARETRDPAKVQRNAAMIRAEQRRRVALNPQTKES